MVIVLLRNRCCCQTLPRKAPTQNDHGFPSFVDVKMRHLHFLSNLPEASGWLTESSQLSLHPSQGTCIQLTLEFSCHHTIHCSSLVLLKGRFRLAVETCCHFGFSDILSGAVGNPIRKRAPLHSRADREVENCRPPQTSMSRNSLVLLILSFLVNVRGDCEVPFFTKVGAMGTPSMQAVWCVFGALNCWWKES